MAVASLLFLNITLFAWLRLASSSSALCPKESNFFLYGLQSQCPLSIFPNPPLQVGGDFLDTALASKGRNEYTSVLFYASWCPFSCSVLPTYKTLSSMFPQIEHLTVEKSSAMPSIFSRFGIHSWPSILMVNKTSRVRYRGPKNLPAFVQFYKKTTGIEPVQGFAEDQPICLESGGTSNFLSSNTALSRLEAFWVTYIPHFNLEIFGETSQIMGRILHMIDVRRVWTKLRLCKTKNFHEGAKNARVWASSLASVALGESSARSST